MSREVAWRLFAGEFNDARKSLTEGTGDRAPTFVLTPLGAKVNRVLVSGVLTDVENLGTDAEPMYRGRVSDPTGTWHLYAGQYQPIAAAALGKAQPPTILTVIGKAKTFTTDQGAVYVSVRPERLKTVDGASRDFSLLEAARSLKRRLAIVRAAYGLETPTPETVRALGCTAAAADGIVKAVAEYGKVDLSRYQAMLAEGLRYLVPEEREAREAVAVDAEAPKAGDDDKVLTLLGGLDRDGKGAAWDELVAAAAKGGLDASALEQAVDLLLDRGAIYEPVLGRIKRI